MKKKTRKRGVRKDIQGKYLKKLWWNWLQVTQKALQYCRTGGREIPLMERNWQNIHKTTVVQGKYNGSNPWNFLEQVRWSVRSVWQKQRRTEATERGVLQYLPSVYDRLDWYHKPQYVERWSSERFASWKLVGTPNCQIS